MKNFKSLFLAAAAGAVMLTAAVNAETFTSNDGVISIDTMADGWVQTNDPNYGFVITNGNDTIAIDHLSNGEILPPVQVASNDNEAVYQAFVSTKNEVFVVTALASEQADLEDLMKITSTIKVLEPDTKTAIQNQTAPQAEEFGTRAINKVFYCTGSDVNVRSSFSTDSAKIGSLILGQEVSVIGAVTRNGADFGWYQIQYNGGTGYVSAAFLAQTKPAATQAKPAAPAQTAPTQAAPAQEAAPHQLSDGFTVYDGDGNNRGLLRAFSDGLYYSDNMIAYRDNGNGSFTRTDGSEVLFNYIPATGDPEDAMESDLYADPAEATGTAVQDEFDYAADEPEFDAE